MDEREPRTLSKTVERERSRLANFIRRRVPDRGDAEDVLQEVFAELALANRLLMPIEHVTGWLFRVARNRIIDFARRKKPERGGAGGEDSASIADLLPSPEAGPEALHLRNVLLDELELAIDELPEDQRDVFIAHEVEGLSFEEIAAETSVNRNTLLSRKRYAVLKLRERLRDVYDAWNER